MSSTSLATASPMDLVMVRPGKVLAPFHTRISPNSPNWTSTEAAIRPPARRIRSLSIRTEGKWSTVRASAGARAAEWKGENDVS